jgi:hypothetical protein
VRSVGVNEPTDTRILAIRLVQWFEARLDEMVPPRSSVARLYGLEVLDPDGLEAAQPTAVRMVFVCEAADLWALDDMVDAARADDFDAAATVEFRWAPSPAVMARPGDFGRRHRERNVRVVLRR